MNLPRWRSFFIAGDADRVASARDLFCRLDAAARSADDDESAGMPAPRSMGAPRPMSLTRRTFLTDPFMRIRPAPASRPPAVKIYLKYRRRCRALEKDAAKKRGALRSMPTCCQRFVFARIASAPRDWTSNVLAARRPNRSNGPKLVRLVTHRGRGVRKRRRSGAVRRRSWRLHKIDAEHAGTPGSPRVCEPSCRRRLRGQRLQGVWRHVRTACERSSRDRRR